MNEPDFSEFQLEQLANFEIIMKLLYNKGKFYFPFIPNLVQEKKLAYDTGFYFPWLPVPGNPSHKGCNFFIQYKLSTELTGNTAPYLGYWNGPYFRFKIPYRKKNKKTGKRFDDYDQFNNLRKLAKRYSVYYATNQILTFPNMTFHASNLNLLSEVPFLDVSQMTKKHKEVTFTRSSSYFKLHSEIEEIPIQKWEEIYGRLLESEKTQIYEDLEFLSDLIIGIEGRNQLSGKNTYGYRASIIEDIPQDFIFTYKTILVSMYLKRYLNLNWYVI